MVVQKLQSEATCKFDASCIDLMNIVSRYLTRNIAASVIFVLMGFIVLFAFFDFINELDDVGKNGYKVQHAIAYVALQVPNHIYEIMPIACLIGSIYALSQLAANSEFTAMRAAGLGRKNALIPILGLGLCFSFLTIFVGEVVAPPSERLAQKVRLTSMGVGAVGQFRSGVWLKDTISINGDLSLRFVNVGEVKTEGQLTNVRVFDFDKDFRLREIIETDSARFIGNKKWRFGKGKSTVMTNSDLSSSLTLGAQEREFLEHEWLSELNPDIFTVLLVDPSRMSALSLVQYVQHLHENKQNASRYEIAMWKKLIYPLAAVVMMFLALPFAYLQARAGGIGIKVFAGIMLGIAFHFMNGLFSHLGLLNTWPPFFTVAAPPLVALLIATGLLAWVDRT
jgi:lipopolysaccharide export system permease protein